MFTKKRLQILLGTVGVALGLALTAVVRDAGRDTSEPEPTPIPGTPEHREAVRGTLREKAAGRLAAADGEIAAALNARLDAAERFLAERARVGAAPFAERMLSLRGKWLLAASALSAERKAEYQQWMAEEFGRYVFVPGDLDSTVRAAVAGFLADLDERENRMAVALYRDYQAELADTGLSAEQVMPALASPEQYAAHVRRVTADVVPTLSDDLKVAVGQQVASLIGGEVATGLAVRIGQVVLTRLGVSAAVLGTGAASGAVTLGVGLIVGLILDRIIERLTSWAGYDGATAVADQVTRSVTALGRDVRTALRAELEKVHAVRGKIRAEAVRRLATAE